MLNSIMLSAYSNSCDVQITPNSAAYLSDLRTLILGLTAACGVVAVVTIGIFIEELYRLYKPPRCTGYPRQKAAALLAIYPVTTVNALLAIVIPRASGICDLAMSLYFAFCLYMFSRMTFHLFGGKSQMAARLKHQIVPIRSPPCCCCLVCVPMPKLTRRHVELIDWSVRQFVIVRPIVMFSLGLILADNLLYGGTKISPTSAAVEQILRTINTITTMVAVYGNILLLRLATEAMPRFRFRAKFYLIQGVLVLESLQRLILVALAFGGVIGCLPPLNVEATMDMIHHMLLVAYMLILSVVARKCYRQDFEIPQDAQDGKNDAAQEPCPVLAVI